MLTHIRTTMDQVITLDRNDDILKVHSKVEWSDGRRVVLVVPRGAKALDSEHELRLVHRWADDADVQVALVSDDFKVRQLAAATGLPVYSSVPGAQRARWKWRREGRGQLTRATALDPGEPRPKQPIFDRLGLAGVELVVTLFLFAVATTVLAFAALLLIPSAQISIVPAAVTISDARDVILDPTVTTVDQINGILPATSFRREISGTATIATTKTATAPADHATGQVVFTNLAGTPATIPAGTIVETSSGVTVQFTTTAPAQLPAGYNARVTVPVRAVDAGPIGNVRALQINVIEGPLGALARVVNPTALAGGTIKEVHVVSFDDKTNLSAKLNDELRAAAVQRLQTEAGPDTFILPASVDVSVLSQSFDHLVDDPADALSLHVEAVATGVAVDRSDLEQFAQADLTTKMPKGYSILPDTLKVSPDLNGRVEGNAVIFSLRSSFQVTPQVRTGDVLKGLTGTSPEDAAALIGRRVKLAEPPRIEISPSWFPRLPFFGFRLALFVHAMPEAQAQSQ
jgi:Baseplate J-like protein